MAMGLQKELSRTLRPTGRQRAWLQASRIGFQNANDFGLRIIRKSSAKLLGKISAQNKFYSAS
jgi:hypothetical protein